MKHILLLASFLVMSLPAAAKPLKVFILAGQSNMEGHAHIDPAFILTPPKGLEAGYVPIATRQELEK